MKAALEDALERRPITSPIPPEQQAVLVSALVNGLAVEELSDPGSVPDDLLGAALTLLLEAPGDRDAASPARAAAPGRASTTGHPGRGVGSRR